MTQVFTILLLAAFWGGSFVAIQAIVHDAPPVAAAFWRVVTATALTFVYSRLRHIKRPSKSFHRHAMMSGFLSMGFPWALLFWAEQHVNGAMGAIMNATVPIMVVLLNPMFNPGIRILLRQWIGILVAFAGIMVIFGPRVLSGPASDGWAILALGGMVFGYATSLLYTHRYLKGVPPSIVAGWQGVSAGVFLLVVALISGEQVASPVFWNNKTVWMGIAYLAIFSTLIANILFVKLIQNKGSIVASLITFLIPVFSILIEWVWMGVSPGLSSLAGLLLVMAGLYMVQFYKGRRFRRVPIIPPTEEAAIE